MRREEKSESGLSTFKLSIVYPSTVLHNERYNHIYLNCWKRKGPTGKSNTSGAQSKTKCLKNETRTRIYPTTPLLSRLQSDGRNSTQQAGEIPAIPQSPIQNRDWEARDGATETKSRTAAI